MKKVSLSIVFITAILLSVLAIRAQTANDSAGAPAVVDTATRAAVAQEVTAQTTTTIDGVTIPQPVQSLFISVLAMLPMLQLILKRIPTTSSVKICGWVGKILDFLTAWQSDCKAGGGVHPDACAVKK